MARSVHVALGQKQTISCGNVQTFSEHATGRQKRLVHVEVLLLGPCCETKSAWHVFQGITNSGLGKRSVAAEMVNPDR